MDHNSLKEVKHYDPILVLDFGGQYCHLIARRIRELRVYSEIASSNISPTEIQALQKQHNIKGIIFSGGPASVYNEEARAREILSSNCIGKLETRKSSNFRGYSFLSICRY